MTDPDFVIQLVALPDVGGVEVLEAGSDDEHRWITARFAYNGSLDPIAARALGSGNPSWTQTYRMRIDGSAGRLTIAPGQHSSLLDCSAAVTIREVDGGIERLINGMLKVRLPLVGGRAERALVPAILRRLDVEAQLLDRWLMTTS